MREKGGARPARNLCLVGELRREVKAHEANVLDRVLDHDWNLRRHAQVYDAPEVCRLGKEVQVPHREGQLAWFLHLHHHLGTKVYCDVGP